MNTGKYSLLEILEFTNLEQFVVPEMQRDYVWGEDDVLDLLKSIEEGFEGNEADIPYLGFIYAYNDKDYPYKYFLVDGQQRLTTICLLLLACHLKLGKEIPHYLFNKGKLKLDYKVRQTTHDFMIDLFNYIQENQDNYDFIIEEQIWYHGGYENDKTICSVIQNFNAIKHRLNIFNEEQLGEFLKFVEEKVELSYFKIENGREGEELYIYMNARGKQLELNETLKARFLTRIEDEKDKLDWGRKWEVWQDFFWKYRGESLDADDGFNEFLRIVQIIHMCSLGDSTIEISDFASRKSNDKLNIDQLPDNLAEIEKYFQALKWLVETEQVCNFFNKYEQDKYYLLNKNPKLIDYLRLLPILGFLVASECRDVEIVIRFVRFIYNVSRKDNVGKDIAGQLPIAIKLMLEYGNSSTSEYDVCDLIDYKKDRRVLIDEEEVIKLFLFRNPPSNVTRHNLEELFWEAEDHGIFDGQIMFLLSVHFDEDELTINLSEFRKTWSTFKTIFPNKKNDHDHMISRVLLFYGNTWVRSTPYYYNNYNCHDWYALVRIDAGKHLLALLEDVQDKPVAFLDLLFKRKAREYFDKNNYNSIKNIQAAESLRDQIRVLATIDYHSEYVLWKSSGYLAEDERCDYGDKQFFHQNRVIFNAGRYINDGAHGRIIAMMNDTIGNETKLNQILKDILSFDDL